MPALKENSFQLARYLLENPEIDEQAEIRNELELSEQDFLQALKYLGGGGLCQTAGQSGKGIIHKRNLAQLQDFVDKANEERISLSRDAERLLKFLMDKCSPDFPFFPYLPIMNKFKWDEAHYMDIAQELQDNKMVEGNYASGNPFFTISLTDIGRQVIRNDFRKFHAQKNPIHVEQIITTFSGNNNVVNIGSILDSVTQSIQANVDIESSAKHELENLLLRLENELSGVPTEHKDNAEAVAEMAKNLIEKATREKPNKPLVQISADGLKKAAQNIADIAPNVLVVAQAIITFLIQLR